MMRKLVVVTAASLLALALACEGPATKPAEGPGTEYPCGIRGVSCGNHMCCWEGDECNVPSCPKDMCCWVGPGAVGMRQVVRPQRHE